MATKQTKRKAVRKPAATQPNDGAYLLKLVLYTIIGTQWLWFQSQDSSIPVPIGLLVGLIFAMHEHFRVDRKIEFAVLLAAMLAGFVAKVGLIVNI